MPATAKFERARTSPFTGTQYDTIAPVEWKIAEALNNARRNGFECKKEDGSGRNVYPARDHDLIFDCRLWWTAKLHSEDMTVRGYYDHYTKAGTFTNSTSGQTETLARLSPFDRSKQWAWGMPSNTEVIVAYPVNAAGLDDDQYAQKVVESWLASPTHCNGIAIKGNQLVGVARAYCAKTGGADGSICQSVEGDDTDSARWYWTAMFTWAAPSYTAKRGVRPPPEVGGDTSCQLSSSDAIAFAA